MPIIHHTPGPWRASRHPAIDSSEPWQVVAANIQHPNARLSHYPLPIAVLDRTVEGSVEHANALLLAAAPELLEALKAMMPEGEAWYDGTMDHMPGIKQARLAIAKATFGTEGGE